MPNIQGFKGTSKVLKKPTRDKGWCVAAALITKLLMVVLLILVPWEIGLAFSFLLLILLKLTSDESSTKLEFQYRIKLKLEGIKCSIRNVSVLNALKTND